MRALFSTKTPCAGLFVRWRAKAKGCEIPELGEEYREWKLLGLTGNSSTYIEETRTSKKMWGFFMAGVAVIIGFIKWLIPVIVSLWKK